MSSRGSGAALGLGSQPSTNSAIVQRIPVPALSTRAPRSRSLALLGREESCKGSSGSFCTVGAALGADPLGRSCPKPDPQLVRRIVAQVEFYLSDENLAKDAFLLKHVQKNKMGFVSIKLLTSFKKVKYLTRDWRLTLYALRFSELLEVNEEGTKVRRRVPIPQSLLSIPPSKLLLAWELQPRAQDALSPLQKNFLETITSTFSPFGAITSIRILRPGRKLPSDVRKFASRFPELLSRCCALVEYESLEGARRALQELGQRGAPGGQSIRVVQLSGKGSTRKAEAAEEPVDQLGWEAPAAAATLPYGLGGSLFGSGREPDGASALPSLLLTQGRSEPTWPSGDLEPSGWSSDPFTASLLTSDLFSPFDDNVGAGAGGCFSPSSSPESPWGSGAAAWGPWGSCSSRDPKPPPGLPRAAARVSQLHGLCDGGLRLPRGPDGTDGFSSSIGRGELVLQH